MTAVNATIPKFTLTCNSTGGPATNVTWTVDGSPVSDDGDHSFSQVVVNRERGKYSNTLTVTGMKPGNYQCTVSNARGNDTSPIFEGICKLVLSNECTVYIAIIMHSATSNYKCLTTITIIFLSSFCPNHGQ